jgi:hypothetical protein
MGHSWRRIDSSSKHRHAGTGEVGGRPCRSVLHPKNAVVMLAYHGILGIRLSSSSILEDEGVRFGISAFNQA